MRKTIDEQERLVPLAVAHVHARELTAMSKVLDGLPEAAALVAADLVGKRRSAKKGRAGMSGDQVLRALMVKQMTGFSYDELAFHLVDSASYRRFCRIGIGDRPPKKSTLQRNIKKVKAETLEAINVLLMKHAQQADIEHGRKVRTDCTVVNAAVHAPSDSSLLLDCVVVLTRLLGYARQYVQVGFTNHTRRAKRRAIGIQHAATKANRLPLYRDLLEVTENTVAAAEGTAPALDAFRGGNLLDEAAAQGLAEELRQFVGLARRVIDQTRRRVLDGKTVPALEKIVSIFEPHVDIIVKDRRETLFGHKICLTGGASGLVTDVMVLSGNPCDATLALEMVRRQVKLYGRPPRQVSFDGGFASRENLEAIKGVGVKDVAFSKGRGMAVTEMVKSSWVYRKLRNFRAGVEGIISLLKRAFGLGRCTWRSLPSFKAYAWASVLTANVLVVARHALA